MHETTRLLRDLVSRPSINPMGRELSGPEYYEHQVTAYLDDFFRSLGVRYERQPIAPLRENIVAYWEPEDATSTLVFEAHQDIVPVEGMTIDPFGATIEDGRLYGRGACDIKGGMASMLAAFARVVREKPTRSCRAIMACTVDEEHTFLGIQRLVQDSLGRNPDDPVAAVVAEPTDLQIVNAHKGVVRWRISTKGRSCHSSRPEMGVNAIYHMASVLTLLDEYAERLQASKSDPVLGPPTLSVGLIEGGSSVNTVPDHCRIDIDRRLIPGEDPLDAIEEVRAYVQERLPADVEVVFSEPILQMPALDSRGSEVIAGRLGAVIDEVVGSHQVMPVPYGTDASTLSAAGIPTVVFGPGDIAQAHTCNESVPLDEVERASEILYRLILRNAE